MMSRRRIRSFGESPVDGHQFEVWFDTNGASDPTSFAPIIESVTRKATAGGVEFYRIKLREAVPVGTYNAAAPWAENLTSDTLVPVILKAANAASGGLRDDGQEIDVGVIDLGGPTYTNQVTAGQRVGVVVVIDYSETT